jgi:hypothetical protein
MLGSLLQLEGVLQLNTESECLSDYRAWALEA